jgi:dihydrofolate reductase
MKIILIAAHDPDLVIGKDGGLPWHYPEDLKHFKKRTLGKPVVMGRRVFEEIGEKPLPGRRNVVISTTKVFENVETYASPKLALASLQSEPEVYIIGGAGLYREFMAVADRLELTLVHKSYKGDVYFPEYRHLIGQIWLEIQRVETPDLTFVDYIRIQKS